MTHGQIRVRAQSTREVRQPMAEGRTGSRVGIGGTDLGSSFEHQGRLWFLFGDTNPVPPAEHSHLAAVSREAQHQEVFSIDREGYVRGRWFWEDGTVTKDHGPWRGGYTLGGGFPPTSGIAAVSRHRTHMEVFVVGRDRDIHGRYHEDGWKNWFVLGRPDNHPGFDETTSLAAVSRDPRHMEVFAVDAAGTVHGRFFQDGWREDGERNWFVLDGPDNGVTFSPTGGIAAVSRHPHHMELFAVGRDKLLWGRTWEKGHWHDRWYPVGGDFGLEGRIAAVSRSPQHMEVFAIGAGGTLRGKWFWDGWKDWFPLDSAFVAGTGGLAAVSRRPDHMEVFTLSATKDIHAVPFYDKWRDAHDIGLCTDSVASTSSTDPHDLRLEFRTNSIGRYISPRLRTRDGTTLRTDCCEVPVAGFSTGDKMYVFHSTNSSKEDDTGRDLMGRTYLAEALGGDPVDLQVRYLMSDLEAGGKFINIACHVAPRGWPGLPFQGPALLAWGSGRYRQSPVHFACAPLGQVGTAREKEEAGWQYFSVLAPFWTSAEVLATPVLAHPVVGELSVTWLAPLSRWLMLYNSNTTDPRGILARVSETPVGPWSDPPMIAYNPLLNAEVGWGRLLHQPGDNLSDPGYETRTGDPYGPYVIDRFTRDVPPQPGESRACEVFFMMSTWNPYTAVLMAVTLALDS